MLNRTQSEQRNKLLFLFIAVDQGWATPGSRADFGARARISGTRVKPRKQVNGNAAAEVSLINSPFAFFFIGHTSRREDLCFFALHLYFQWKTGHLRACA